MDIKLLCQIVIKVSKNLLSPCALILLRVSDKHKASWHGTLGHSEEPALYCITTLLAYSRTVLLKFFPLSPESSGFPYLLDTYHLHANSLLRKCSSN